MTVEIKIIGEDAGHALRELSGLSSGLLASTAPRPPLHDVPAPGPGDGAIDITPPSTETADANVKRERGKPAPGRSRRTKEEIAEDEAAEKAEGSSAQAISTGGERVSPEDEPEVQEQDEADEQAEVEASRDPEKPLTVDDVKAAVGLYVNKFGMPATNEDGPSIFVKALGQPPEGNPFWKMSILPDDQKKLKACVDEWSKAAAGSARYGQ